MYVIKTLNEALKEGRLLYNELFITPSRDGTVKELRRKIDLHARYDFLSQLFQEMQAFNWLEKDFKFTDENVN